jgi:glycosyltransferase involved in cell wall biosynthesis
MQNPTVTVILPTYNWSSVLRFAIASVLRQTFTDFELLVIGDGCTDDSEQVAAEAGDPRVRWINLPANTGHQSGPNNEALRQARGELIAYHGHDDLWLPHHLGTMVAALQTTGAELAHSLCFMVPADGVPGWILIPQRELGTYAPPLCVVHRRSLTERIGGWRPYRELGTTPPDVELWRRAAASGAKFTFVSRLTGVKFPASVRRDVYRTRPHHEQETWSARIASEPDIEAHLLAEAVMRRTELMESWSYRELLRGFVRQTARRLRTRLRFRNETLDAIRRYKGLDR